MWRVLIEIDAFGVPIRIFGFGAMLVLAFLVAPTVAARTAAKYGGDREMIYDLVYWLVLPGLLGARVFYVIQYWHEFDHPFVQFFKIWEGGMVVYGSVIGAIAGFLLFTRRRKLRKLWLLDIIAPSVALGLGIGRLGCLLNGCCFGDVCIAPWSVTFPPGSPPHERSVQRGWQSRLGAVIDPATRAVLALEPGSEAERHGLAVGDVILAVEGGPELRDAPYQLLVRRDGIRQTLSLHAPRSLPLQPTQIYSAIDGVVLFYFLNALLAVRRREGTVMATLAILYSVTRFLIEYLRSDEAPLADGLTISQNVSLALLLAGLVMLVAALRRKTNGK